MNRAVRCFRYLSTLVFGLASGMLAAEPLAWITNNSSNNVSVIDTATDTISGAPISLFPSPRAVAVSPTHVFVTHGNDILSIINKTTRIVTTKNLPSNTLVGVAASPDGSRVYVSGYGTNQLFVIDTTNNNALIAALPVSKPFGIAVKPDGSRAYIAYDDGLNARVAVLDTTTNTLLPPLALSGREPTGIAISPDGTRLFVCVTATDRVAILNLDTMTVSSLDVGGEPRGIVVNHAGTRAYFTEALTNQVGVINTASQLVIDHFPSGGNLPWGIDVSADDSRVYVANHDSGNVGIRNVLSSTLTTRSVGTNPIAFGRFIDAYVPPQVPPVLGNVPDQNAVSGTPFTLDLVNHVATTNGDPITGFAIIAGSLPEGLTLNTTTGLISGTPLLAGRGASITVTVSDDDGPSNADTIGFTIASPASSTPRELLVGSYTGGLRGFALGATGNVAPTRTLVGPNTQLVYPYGLDYEDTEGTLFVSDFSGQAIRAFDGDARGDTPPRRTLASAWLGQPRGVAVDRQHGEIAVIGGGCFPCFWPLSARGNDEPVRRLIWGIGNPFGLALNPPQDEVLIGDADASPPNEGKILVFPRTANGQVSPTRVIQGANTRIGPGSGSQRIALDPVLQVLYVLTQNVDPVNANLRHLRVLAFPAGASGNVMPLRVIEGSNTQLDIPSTQIPYGLSFDPATQRLMVSIYSNVAAENRVLSFYAGDQGNVAPLTSLGGAATGLDRIGTAVVVPVNLILRDGFEN